jgi:hypothetical protein
VITEKNFAQDSHLNDRASNQQKPLKQLSGFLYCPCEESRAKRSGVEGRRGNLLSSVGAKGCFAHLTDGLAKTRLFLSSGPLTCPLPAWGEGLFVNTSLISLCSGVPTFRCSGVIFSLFYVLFSLSYVLCPTFSPYTLRLPLPAVPAIMASATLRGASA